MLPSCSFLLFPSPLSSSSPPLLLLILSPLLTILRGIGKSPCWTPSESFQKCFSIIHWQDFLYLLHVFYRTLTCTLLYNFLIYLFIDKQKSKSCKSYRELRKLWKEIASRKAGIKHFFTRSRTISSKVLSLCWIAKVLFVLYNAPIKGSMLWPLISFKGLF